MVWLDRMNNAVDYIELNLANEISYEKLAQIACSSTYHFQRMFSFISGVPLSEYIKRRRLTFAAFEVFGLELKTTVVNGQCQALVQAAGKKLGELLDAGVTYAHNLNGYMSYMLGCVKQDQVVSPEYKTLAIPKQTWAIFQTEWKSECDDEKLHEVWRRIFVYIV